MVHAFHFINKNVRLLQYLSKVSYHLVSLVSRDERLLAETPPESPDLNSIEMLWHELKHFLRTIVKPTTKEDLLAGITRFWRERVTAEKCTTYINHLKKVVPLVIQREGRASGH